MKILKFAMFVECENDAFDDGNQELARIVQQVGKAISARSSHHPPGVVGELNMLYDVNGNTIGHWSAELEEEEPLAETEDEEEPDRLERY